MRFTKKKSLLALLSAAVLGSAIAVGSLTAQEGDNQRHRARHCQEDIQNFCSDIERGDREGMHQCLQENQSQLSPACSNHLSAMLEIRSACQADVDQYCAEHKGNRQAMRQCMRENRENLSSGCRTALRNHRQRANQE